METGPLEQAALDQYDAWARDTVRRYGWAVRYIFGDVGDVPPFAYTIGLYGFDHPELVLFGADYDTSVNVLNWVGERVRAGGRIEPGELLTFDDWPHRLHVLTVPNPGEIVLSANRFYGRSRDESVPALQLVWDDRWGRFPWEPDYDPPAWLQPMPGTFSALPGLGG